MNVAVKESIRGAAARAAAPAYMRVDAEELVRGAASHAADRAYVRRMAAEGRSWEALQANLLPLGIDLSTGERPVIYAIQGERVKKTTNLSA